MKLSAVMIVKNEEDMLGRCLESIREMDEVIVLDTGSTDNTSKVASMYPNVKYISGTYTWNDNFAEARNKSISYSSGDWNFTIDADEFLEEGGVDKIRDFISKLNISVRVVDIPSRSEVDGSIHYLPRLFKNEKDLIYHGAIHNYLSQIAQDRLDVYITYGVSPAHSQDPDRAFRILKKEVEKHRECTREKFYLAREYWYRHDWITALYWYDQYLKVSKFPAEMCEAHLVRARCLFYLFRGDEARSACMEAIKLNSNFQEAIEFMATMCGPGNRLRWLRFATTATNDGVLFIRTNNNKRVYYCEGMATFGEPMTRYHGYERYDPDLDVFRDTFFEGLYFPQDFEYLKLHKGRAIVFWNGTDITRLANSPYKKTVDWNKYVHYCHNYEDYQRLLSLNIRSKVRPIFFGDINKFKISYVQSDIPHFFLNAHPDRESEYNVPLALEVASEMPDVVFHFFGINGKSYGNVIYHGIVPEGEMDEEIKNYQGCIKLNPSGISQIVVKAGLMGQYPIAINPVSGALYAPNKLEIKQAIEHVRNTKEPNELLRNHFLSVYRECISGIWGDAYGA